ncbi:hypothetical protein E2C01_002916 [Portunus trituberculatus]|uniref:Uncharacterized protein n=1 Tax=Portunus trituberculatus TaxID=210409 RepID=A0A5B7CNS8_PORTR|nr:hypothetical protein [Portunus trituberculatus]
MATPCLLSVTNSTEEKTNDSHNVMKSSLVESTTMTVHYISLRLPLPQSNESVQANSSLVDIVWQELRSEARIRYTVSIQRTTCYNHHDHRRRHHIPRTQDAPSLAPPND